MAIYIMVGNFAGIVGSQIFREADRPLYRAGWSVSVGVLSAAVAFGLLANFQYRYLNRRKVAGEENGQGDAETRIAQVPFKYSL